MKHGDEGSAFVLRLAMVILLWLTMSVLTDIRNELRELNQHVTNGTIAVSCTSGCR